MPGPGAHMPWAWNILGGCECRGCLCKLAGKFWNERGVVGGVLGVTGGTDCVDCVSSLMFGQKFSPFSRGFSASLVCIAKH